MRWRWRRIGLIVVLLIAGTWIVIPKKSNDITMPEAIASTSTEPVSADIQRRQEEFTQKVQVFQKSWHRVYMPTVETTGNSDYYYIEDVVTIAKNTKCGVLILTHGRYSESGVATTYMPHMRWNENKQDFERILKDCGAL